MNMRPESLYKHRPFLNFLYHIGPEQFGKLFMTDAQVLVIGEIIENILLGNLNLRGAQIGELRKFQKVLRPLRNIEKPSQLKKDLSKHHREIHSTLHIVKGPLFAILDS